MDSPVCSSLDLSLDKNKHWVFVFISCNRNGDLDDINELHGDLSLSHYNLIAYFKHQLMVNIRIEGEKLSLFDFSKRRMNSAHLSHVNGANIK